MQWKPLSKYYVCYLHRFRFHRSTESIYDRCDAWQKPYSETVTNFSIALSDGCPNGLFSQTRYCLFVYNCLIVCAFIEKNGNVLYSTRCVGRNRAGECLISKELVKIVRTAPDYRSRWHFWLAGLELFTSQSAVPLANQCRETIHILKLAYSSVEFENLNRYLSQCRCMDIALACASATFNPDICFWYRSWNQNLFTNSQIHVWSVIFKRKQIWPELLHTVPT